jgi:hypothetical protein
MFVRGRATYSANMNATNPIGTVQSIEHTLRSLEKLAAEQRSYRARIEKELLDYQSQADRPFEHEERLKQLITRQSELNSLLDLDKGDQQGAAPASEMDEPVIGLVMPPASQGRDEVAKMAEEYMRRSGTAIREMPIAERTPPQTGPVTGRAVAKDETNVAIATSANSFIIVQSTALGRDVFIGEQLSLRFCRGRALVDDGRDRGR